MKTFRTIAVIATTSLAVMFTNCKPEIEDKPPVSPDATSPVINVPVDPTFPIVDLGDKEAALKNVTASDDVDGDITKFIKVLSDLETVGLDTIKYEVSDAAGNKATATRVVWVSCSKLAGKYEIIAYDIKDTIKKYPITNEYVDIIASENLATKRLDISAFHQVLYNQKLGWNISLYGNGQPRELQINDKSKLESTDGGGHAFFASGNVVFESVDAAKTEYRLVSFHYKMTPDVTGTGAVPIEYIATCKKLK